VKQQLKNYILFIILIAVFVTPSFVLAAWWNPFSWGFWNSFSHRQNNVVCTQEVKLCPDGSYASRKGPKCEFTICPKLIGGDKDSHGCLIAAGYSWCEIKNKCLRTWEEKCEANINANALKNITLSYPNPYDTTKTDSIKLVNGKAVIYDAGNIKPRGYDVATTATGDLDGDGIADGVIGIYQSYGANIITPIIFVFSNKNGALTQTDSVLPDSSAWNYETQIKSLSIDNGILSVNLLVLAAKDQSLPHYQQQPTVAKTVQYKLVNGKLVIQPVDQTAGWQTISDDKNTFTYKCPNDWKKGYSFNYNAMAKYAECSKITSKFAFDDGVDIKIGFVSDEASKYIWAGEKWANTLINEIKNETNSQPYTNNGFTGWISMKNQKHTLVLIARMPANGGYYEISAGAEGSAKTDTEYKAIIDQILSTFKFTPVK
jgi:hypothetical protein